MASIADKIASAFSSEQEAAKAEQVAAPTQGAAPAAEGDKPKEKEVKWVKVKISNPNLGAISYDGVTYVANNGITDVPEDIMEALVKAKVCEAAPAEKDS